MSYNPTRQIDPTNRSELHRLGRRTLGLETRGSYLMMRFNGKPQPSVSQPQLFPEPLGFNVDQCRAVAKTAATASATFTLKLAGTAVGTVTFGAGETEGLVACTLQQIPAFEEFDVVPPASQDATLADVTLAFAVQR